MQVVFVGGIFLGTGMVVGFLAYFLGYSVSAAGDIGLDLGIRFVPWIGRAYSP